MSELPSIVPGLAALGGAAAQESLARGEPFLVTVEDVAIRVEYTSGTTPTVFLTTPYAPRGQPGAAAGYRDPGIERLGAARPMMIELALETEDDWRAKRSGVSREVQTGDAGFDRAVYVCSSSEDRVVSRVLASGRLRAAVRMLLEDGFGPLEIDDENGNIATRRGISARARAGADEVARAFAVIAREVPVVERTARRVRRAWPLAAMVALLVGVPAVIGAAFFTAPPGWVALACLVGGTLGAGLGILIGHTQRGRSDSHWRIRAVVIASVCAGALAATAAVLWSTAAIGWPLAVGGAVAGSLLLAIARA